MSTPNSINANAAMLANILKQGKNLGGQPINPKRAPPPPPSADSPRSNADTNANNYKNKSKVDVEKTDPTISHKRDPPIAPPKAPPRRPMSNSSSVPMEAPKRPPNRPSTQPLAKQSAIANTMVTHTSGERNENIRNKTNNIQLREAPYVNANLNNIASGGKRAVQTATHLDAQLVKTANQELDGSFRQVLINEAGVDDMVLLIQVTDDGIERNIKQRFNDEKIYTYIGPILISVNPYRQIPNLTSKETISKYKGRAIQDISPHVFALTDNMHRKMMEDNLSQCVIISGESGAGKTEASKLVMNYLSEITTDSNTQFGTGGDHIAAQAGNKYTYEGMDKVKATIFSTNPLLESFGNAKTLRNDNSSRFGKFFEITFDGTSGKPVGGLISSFLLEKSRVVRQSPGERNFHIFYQLIAGMDAAEKEYYYLTDPSDFYYLRQSDCYTVATINDKQEFNDVIAAMQSIGITNNNNDGGNSTPEPAYASQFTYVQNIWRILAGILHLGNIRFDENTENNSDGSLVTEDSPLEFTAWLLGITDVDLFKKKLTSRLLQSMGGAGRGSVIDLNFTVIQAESARDTLAKHLFSRLFDKLIEVINHSLDTADTASAARTSSNTSIGVLDIYGFEIFQRNGFEQFCINYVNEKLQQIFIDLTIKSEEKDYRDENIPFDYSQLAYFDNKIVCELIESRKNPPIIGLFPILDDVCKTMRNENLGSVDAKFLEKVNDQLTATHSVVKNTPTRANQKNYSTPADCISVRGTSAFIISHYAGDVEYDCSGFVEKNKDVLFPDLLALFNRDNNESLCMHALFDVKASATESGTAGSKIVSQCETLIKKLRQCEPNYIRCIKPNDDKLAGKWDSHKVLHQVKYLNLLENIKIRRSGFAYRGEYARFWTRYNICHKETRTLVQPSDTRSVCVRLLSLLLISESDYVCGKTKLFIKTPEIVFGLDDLRDRVMNHYAGKIQRFMQAHNPKQRVVFEERLAWWNTMETLFRSMVADPLNPNYMSERTTHDFGRYISWPEYKEHLSPTVNWAWKIWHTWWGVSKVRLLSYEDQLAMRQKIIALNLFADSTKPWDPALLYAGNYLSRADIYPKYAPVYKAAERHLLQTHTKPLPNGTSTGAKDSIVLFADIVDKINKRGKAHPTAIVVSTVNMYKCNIKKKFELIKKPIPFNMIVSVTMSTYSDGFVVIAMKEPHRDLVLNLKVGATNKAAELVTMLYQSHHMALNNYSLTKLRDNQDIVEGLDLDQLQINMHDLAIHFKNSNIPINLSRTIKSHGEELLLSFEHKKSGTKSDTPPEGPAFHLGKGKTATIFV